MTALLIPAALDPRALISEAQLRGIVEFNESLSPNSVVVVASTYYAPWVTGWTDAQVIAQVIVRRAGITARDWNALRTEGETEVLETLIGGPFFIYDGDASLHLTNEACYEKQVYGPAVVYRYMCA